MPRRASTPEKPLTDALSCTRTRGSRTRKVDPCIVLFLVLGAVLVLALSGCSWGHREELAIDAAARDSIAQSVAVEARKVKLVAIEARNRMESAKDEGQEPSVDDIIDVAQLDASSEKLETLAKTSIGRSKTARLYHGTPPDLQVEVGSDYDRQHAARMGGLAVEAGAKREAPKKLVKDVANFVADQGGMIVEVVKDRVPWWLWAIIVVTVVLLAGTAVGWVYTKITGRKVADDYHAIVDYLKPKVPKEEMEKAVEGKKYAKKDHARKKMNGD